MKKIEGVNGTRVLLGKITFNRNDTGDPDCGSEDSYFGISLVTHGPPNNYLMNIN